MRYVFHNGPIQPLWRHLKGTKGAWSIGWLEIQTQDKRKMLKTYREASLKFMPSKFHVRTEVTVQKLNISLSRTFKERVVRFFFVNAAIS